MDFRFILFKNAFKLPYNAVCCVRKYKRDHGL